MHSGHFPDFDAHQRRSHSTHQLHVAVIRGERWHCFPDRTRFQFVLPSLPRLEVVESAMATYSMKGCGDGGGGQREAETLRLSARLRTSR